jgi:hypothetical protein
MKKAFVICCNDAVIAVHLGTEAEAQAAIEPLARADYDRNHWHWDDGARQHGSMYQDGYAYYRRICYWHLHDAPIVG